MGGLVTLELSEDLFDRIASHAVEGYPAEVCGFLLGEEGEARRVRRVKRGTNLLAGNARDRYLIDPQDTLEAEKEARESGMEVLGFYHSHPDHPAVPSSHDRERAWPWYSYLIVATTPDGVQAARSWRFQDERMVEDPVRLTQQEMVEGV